MTSDALWTAASKTALEASLGRVRAALESAALQRANGGPAAAQTGEALALPRECALARLADLFGLSAFEIDVLALCAGCEIDASWHALITAAEGDANRSGPSFGLALATLEDAHWSALAPDRPLRRWSLVELAPGGSLTAGALRIDECVLHYLMGAPVRDARLRPYLEEVGAVKLPDTHQRQATELAGLLRNASAQGANPALQLCGRRAAELHALAASAAMQLGLGLFALRARDLPASAHEREWLARSCQREALLQRAAILVDQRGGDPEVTAAFVEDLAAVMFAAGDEPLRLERRPCIRVRVSPPSLVERTVLWRSVLGEHGGRVAGELRALAAQFDLPPQDAHAAALHALAASDASGAPLAGCLRNAALSAARRELEVLAERIEPRASWADLILPRAQLETLREVVAHVRHRDTVQDDWGFAEKSARGLGVSVLLAGASGTGKTMAAEVVAAELGLELYRIDLSRVVSKWLGETEKNLKRVFEAAEGGRFALLFDEADALFGRRSEVRDSHDRYANLEVSFLLQQVEAFRNGVSFLTTNQKTALDPALLRRLRFSIPFPFPDAQQRSEIWRRTLPDRMPVRELDFTRLGRLNVSGGSIRNIAMAAAFVSAECGQPLEMSHILRAARLEYQKLDKNLSDAEVAGWI